MRAFAWFVGSILLAGLIGASIAYPAYEWISSFSNFAFHRVASRLFMLVLATLLVWLCRHLNLRHRRDFGYGLPWRRFLEVSLIWMALGIATASLGAVFLLSTQLRVLNADFIPSASSVARIFLIGLGSGIAVALVEETLFRGVMHTGVERESGPWMAAALTAPLFAVLHFTAKARIADPDLGWGSGFDLLLLSFAPLGHPALVFDAFMSWLMVGLILSLTRALTGNIAVAIGLHAGWVVVLRMLQLATRNGTASSAWVAHFDGLLGFWMLPWGAAIAAVLWLKRGSWASYASGLSTSSR